MPPREFERSQMRREFERDSFGGERGRFSGRGRRSEFERDPRDSWSERGPYGGEGPDERFQQRRYPGPPRRMRSAGAASMHPPGQSPLGQELALVKEQLKLAQKQLQLRDEAER